MTKVMNEDDLETIIDKRIAAAFRRLAVVYKTKGLSTVGDYLQLADELDPPAKEEVRLNPCGKCGAEMKGDKLIYSTGCDLCDNTTANYDTQAEADAAWNAANPVKPPCCDKCGKPIDGTTP